MQIKYYITGKKIAILRTIHTVRACSTGAKLVNGALCVTFQATSKYCMDSGFSLYRNTIPFRERFFFYKTMQVVCFQ